jgi:hypothetical protein
MDYDALAKQYGGSPTQQQQQDWMSESLQPIPLSSTYKELAPSKEECSLLKMAGM